MQCATVAQTYLGLPCVEKDLRFDYEYAMLSLPEKEKAASMKYHNETIGTEVLAHALAASEYVLQARKFLTKAILEVSDHGNVIAFSHSPLASFASPDTINFPYHIGNADAVVYEVCGDEIISAEYYICQLK